MENVLTSIVSYPERGEGGSNVDALQGRCLTGSILSRSP